MMMRPNAFLAALLCCASVHADLKIINHDDLSVVRYSCILVKGTCGAVKSSEHAASATQGPSLTLQVVHGSNKNSVVVQAPHEDVALDVGANTFKALVSLATGENTITISDEASGENAILKVIYQPQTNPYYVRLIWLTDADGDAMYASPLQDDPQNYEAKLRTAGVLMQTATAEKMHDIGRDRQTFRLERDASGQVKVHTLRAPKSKEYYYGLPDQQWWQETRRWLNQTQPDPYAKNVVLASFTRKEAETGRMKAHTALGGGNLGLFGSASVFSWPNSVGTAMQTFQDSSAFDSSVIHNDSAGRNRIWGLAATTLGATLHETGHTFGLPHCTDRYGIMTRGFDRLNRIFTVVEPPSDANPKEVRFPTDQEARFGHVSASYLQLSPWFQADGPATAASVPDLKFDAKTGQWVISAEDGIAWIGVYSGSDIHGFIEYQAKDRKKRLQLSMEEMVRTINGLPVSRVEVLSASGKAARASVSQR